MNGPVPDEATVTSCDVVVAAPSLSVAVKDTVYVPAGCVRVGWALARRCVAIAKVPLPAHHAAVRIAARVGKAYPESGWYKTKTGYWRLVIAASPVGFQGVRCRRGRS